jgi:hypothetical protein
LTPKPVEIARINREEVHESPPSHRKFSYDADTLKVIAQAFDAAWVDISHHFHGDPSIEDARLRLAHAVLVVAREDSDDAERVKKDALQVMALAYRNRA